jgi:hypothetical protein
MWHGRLECRWPSNTCFCLNIDSSAVKLPLLPLQCLSITAMHIVTLTYRLLSLIGRRGGRGGGSLSCL